jgi:hypothetical protein
MKNSIKTLAFAATLGLGAFALSSGAASAAIVCNADGDCWHVHDRVAYPDTAGIVVHEDNWKWEDGDHAKYRWHEHDGRGYWHGGTWVTF